jgi:molecular chaperone Hsp33
VFDPQAIEFRCTCSRARCEGALLQIEKQEAVAMVQELGKIDMHCDYCGAHYEFDGIDIETLFSRAPGNDANKLH